MKETWKWILTGIAAVMIVCATGLCLQGCMRVAKKPAPATLDVNAPAKPTPQETVKQILMAYQQGQIEVAKQLKEFNAAAAENKVPVAPVLVNAGVDPNTLKMIIQAVKEPVNPELKKEAQTALDVAKENPVASILLAITGLQNAFLIYRKGKK